MVSALDTFKLLVLLILVYNPGYMSKGKLIFQRYGQKYKIEGLNWWK